MREMTAEEANVVIEAIEWRFASSFSCAPNEIRLEVCYATSASKAHLSLNCVSDRAKRLYCCDGSDCCWGDSRSGSNWSCMLDFDVPGARTPQHVLELSQDLKLRIAKQFVDYGITWYMPQPHRRVYEPNIRRLCLELAIAGVSSSIF